MIKKYITSMNIPAGIKSVMAGLASLASNILHLISLNKNIYIQKYKY